jgi:hypothetical protein
LSGAALLTKTVPEVVVRRRLHFSYDTFQEVVFWLMLAAVVATLIVFRRFWRLQRRARDKYDAIDAVLRYLAGAES